MSLDPQVHDWIDAWEQQQAQEQGVSLDTFIAQFCRDAPASLIQEFQAALQALVSMDKMLR
jgi:hypothetical protein